MSMINFTLDTKTKEAKVSIDGNELPSCESFSFYKYDGRFELTISESEKEVSEDLEIYTSHRACGSEIVTTKEKTSKTLANAFISNIFKKI